MCTRASRRTERRAPRRSAWSRLFRLENGVTLIEIMMTLVLLGIIVGWGVLELTSSRRAHAVRVAEEQLVNDIRVNARRADSTQEDRYMLFRNKDDSEYPSSYSFLEYEGSETDPDPSVLVNNGAPDGASVPIGTQVAYLNGQEDGNAVIYSFPRYLMPGSQTGMILRFHPQGQIMYLQYWNGSSWANIDSGEAEILVTIRDGDETSEDARTIKMSLLGDVVTSE